MEEWKIIDKKLTRVFEFKDFLEAVSFVNKVAELAEEENHHPNLLIFSYNKVKVELYTHDANDKITEKDLKLARLIDEINK